MSPAAVLIGASFTATPLQALLQEQGVAELHFTPYNQLLQVLLQAPAAAGGRCVLLLRLADLVRHDRGSPAELAALLAQRAEAWHDALGRFATAQARPPLLLMVPSERLLAQDPALAAQCRRIEAELAATPGLRPLAWADFVAAHPLERPFDPVADKLGHLPFSVAGFAALARWLAGALAAPVEGAATPAPAAIPAAQAAAPGLDRFFERLQLRVGCQPLLEPQRLAQAARLSHTAATFHLSGRRHTEAELRRRLSEGEVCGLAVDVADRFGQYPDAGFLLIRRGRQPRVTDWVLNCVVLGKQVEHCLAHRLGLGAEAAGLPEIVIEQAALDGNQPALDFLQALGSAAGGRLEPAGATAHWHLAPGALARAALAQARAPAALEAAGLPWPAAWLGEGQPA
ncbi:fkbH domain protein [Eleftheria terrae]|uniref:fkbH domain protein n=1 Tax=Eleftheria terrae TaxID=1597781 RepID=UPI00263A87D5|nr:fkbH domain protein [Eleftheria terrae]WKB55882.1 fkbH domain protein [Eleftheria terrae]